MTTWALGLFDQTSFVTHSIKSYTLFKQTNQKQPLGFLLEFLYSQSQVIAKLILSVPPVLEKAEILKLLALTSFPVFRLKQFFGATGIPMPLDSAQK